MVEACLLPCYEHYMLEPITVRTSRAVQIESMKCKAHLSLGWLTSRDGSDCNNALLSPHMLQSSHLTSEESHLLLKVARQENHACRTLL